MHYRILHVILGCLPAFDDAEDDAKHEGKTAVAPDVKRRRV